MFVKQSGSVIDWSRCPLPTTGRCSKRLSTREDDAITAARQELLARIVGSTDQFPQAQLYLGRAYHALGEYANAAQVLGFYVRGRPGSLSGQFFLGRAYLGMEEYGRGGPAPEARR